MENVPLSFLYVDVVGFISDIQTMSKAIEMARVMSGTVMHIATRLI